MNLLLPDTPVDGVTVGELRQDLRVLGVPSIVGGAAIDEATDTKVEVSWGFRGKGNAVMPGRGRVTPSAVDPDNAVDLWINDRVYWSNVPNDVYAMTIGGYPVVKKWLSYREFKVLGRALRTDELAYVAQMVRRLKALLLMGSDLDANYRLCAAAPQIQIPNVAPRA